MMIRTLVYVLAVVVFLSFSLAGCIKNDTRVTEPVVSTCSGTAGPLFTAVKTLVATKCVSCHNNNIANGGMNFSIECNIVSSKARIKIRAVDQGTMPATGTLPASDKTIITNWINAGGNYTN